MFGKIRKWFADLGTAAFQGVSNVLTQTSDGYVLDARQGKTLADRIGTLSSLLTTAKTSLVNAVNELFNKIGDLDDLGTTEKGDVVGAINEIDGSKSNILYDTTLADFTISIPANGVAEGEYDVSLEGYKAISVVGLAPNFDGMIAERCRVYNDLLQYRFSLKDSRVVNNGKPYPRILYVKI